MISRELLKEIIVSNEDYIESLAKIVKRENIALPKKLNKVVVFFGVRRSGKTYFLFDLFKQNKGNSIYIDFEDERLDGFTVEDFQNVKSAFLELKPDISGEKLLFFMDEVQNIKGWEKFARRSQEKENINIFVTGSSSKMTPRQLHTSLRGRSWGIEVFPFSFREYLSTKNVGIKKPYGGNKSLIIKHFADYLRWGGFPEVCSTTSHIEKKKIISEYLDAIFFKDLVERFKISNINLMEALRDKLFSSFAMKISLSAFYKQYKDYLTFSKDSLFNYYRYFLESMIVYEVRKYSPSVYKRLRNPAKIYLIDTGLSRKVTSQDFGRQLENIVFLELKRKGFKPYYFEEKRECDFVARDDFGNVLAFQVAWELNQKNNDREYEGLIGACKTLGVKTGTILTYNDEGSEKIQNVKIEIKPVWKWLVQK